MNARALLLATFIAVSAWPALAVEPDEILDDPALEARAREISQELRCLVCQNQSIDDSNAGLARDLRVLVRERLEAGDSDEEVIDFVTDRYGDFVRLNPPLKPLTYGLWFGPLLLFLVAVGVIVVLTARRRAGPGPAPGDLTPEERRRIEDLLAGKGDDGDDR